MPTDLPIRCSCGALSGVIRGVTARSVNHGICYCDDCQAFVRFLGRAAEVLDADGGTEIVQLSPAQLAWSHGTEHLACLRLTPKGLLRWYAKCCRIPIGNTLPTPHVPIVGVIAFCVDRAACDPRSLVAALGPIRFHVYTRFATTRDAGLRPREILPLSGFARLFGRALLARLRGAHKRSPFFVPGTSDPVAAPYVLSVADLRAVGRI
jgi:hypothetical protein